MPDFGYDVKLAVIVDGEKQDEIPNSPIGQDGNYYDVQVDCTSSKTSGLWDYNAWRLNLDYIESNSKCNLEFTSTLSKEDYDKYIQAGVALRRNTYRGKDITELWKSGKLYDQISNGTFADIYVGDYIVSENEDAFDNKIVWLIADLDNYLGTGDTGNGLQTHHATIIPAYKLQDARMNSAATTSGGYAGSEMYKTTLTNVLNTYVTPDFNGHILTYRNMVTNKVDNNLSNQFGNNGGASSGWEWADRQIDLMSEVNVFGTTVASSSLYDIGIDNRQYAIFQLRPELINQDLSSIAGSTPRRYWYWLKAVTYSEDFAHVGGGGYADSSGASGSSGVRPRFLIGTPDA